MIDPATRVQAPDRAFLADPTADSSWSDALLTYAADRRQRQEHEDRADLRLIGDDDLVSRASYLQREMVDVDARLAGGQLDEDSAVLIRRNFEHQHDLVDQELARRVKLLEAGTTWYRSPQLVPASFVQDLKDRLGGDGFAELVAGYHGGTHLKREGRRFRGLCPFHVEKTPSFVIFEDAHFLCFGCGEGGDVFSFLKLRGFGWIEAVRIVAGFLGVRMPTRSTTR